MRKFIGQTQEEYGISTSNRFHRGCGGPHIPNQLPCRFCDQPGKAFAILRNRAKSNPSLKEVSNQFPADCTSGTGCCHMMR